jgi:hypothetical protein
VPQGFNYQAIARDGSGTVLANLALPVKIDIQTTLAGGTLIYEEYFPSITSNQFGLISLVVGTGTWQAGSAPSFSAIDWKAQPLYLKTIIQYPGTTWTTMGTSQIWGVPYSLVAKDVSGPISKLGITGTTDDMEEALFEVKNKAGNTVFAVYNEGIRAYVGNGSAKGTKGGFAVGGYDATKGSGTIFNLFTLNTDSARFYIDSKPNLKGKKGGFSVGGYDMSKTGVPIHDYLDVSKDSVRIYVDSDPTSKGKKGGFSVGGYDMTKGDIPAQDYMHVSKDSIRIYVDSNPATKGVRGGFAVGGYDLTKGGITVQKFLAVNPDSTRIYTSDEISGFSVGNVQTGVTTSYLRLTPNNYFIGHESGLSTKPGSGFVGKYNSFLGYQAGKGNITGRYNVYLGYQSGLSSTASYNVFIGEETGINNTGGYNTFIGYHSGFSNLGGDSNVFLGNASGNSNQTGASNVFIGNGSGQNNVSSTGNIIIGYQTGKNHKTGDYNVFLGYQAGTFKSTGSNNVFIGYRAGFYNTLSNKLYIANSESYPPLIHGDFANKFVVINDTLPHAMTFFVNGPAGGTVAWATPSDSRLKSNIETIPGALAKVMQLRGVNFEWKDQSVDPGKRMGFIAQEAEKVIPEVVNTKDEYMSMQYAPITALLVEAIKEQQKIISTQNNKMDDLQKNNEMLNGKVESLAKELEQLKQIVKTQDK